MKNKKAKHVLNDLIDNAISQQLFFNPRQMQIGEMITRLSIEDSELLQELKSSDTKKMRNILL